MFLLSPPCAHTLQDLADNEDIIRRIYVILCTEHSPTGLEKGKLPKQELLSREVRPLALPPLAAT